MTIEIKVFLIFFLLLIEGFGSGCVKIIVDPGFCALVVILSRLSLAQLIFLYHSLARNVLVYGSQVYYSSCSGKYGTPLPPSPPPPKWFVCTYFLCCSIGSSFPGSLALASSRSIECESKSGM
jgi:hypothetical protein